MVCRECRNSFFASVITILVLGVVAAPGIVYADGAAGTNGAPASVSIQFTIIIPSRLEVSIPAAGEAPGVFAQFRLNGGALSITATDLSNDPGFSYSSWGNTHELELAHTQQVYTVASP